MTARTEYTIVYNPRGGFRLLGPADQTEYHNRSVLVEQDWGYALQDLHELVRLANYGLRIETDAAQPQKGRVR